MTKIKNTKKGMAKKTLSMSLVVAMLATSNVPVWAAEFSDGTDAAVATEAPAAETFSDETADAPVVDDTTETTSATAVANEGDISTDLTVKVGIEEKSSVVWGGTATVTGKIVATDNAAISGVKYRWIDASTGVVAVNASGAELKGNVSDAGNVDISLVTDETLAGKTLKLYLYTEDGNTTADFNIDTKIAVSVEKKKLTGIAVTNADKLLTYNGFDQSVTLTGAGAATITVNSGTDTVTNSSTKTYYTLSSTSAKNAGEKVTVTATAPEDSAYEGSVSTEVEINKLTYNASKKYIEADVAAGLEYQYTGKEISVPTDKITLKESKKEKETDTDKLGGADLSSAIKKATIASSVKPSASGTAVTVTLDKNQLKNFGGITDDTTVATTEKVTIKKRDLSTAGTKIAMKYSNVPNGTNAAQLAGFLTFTGVEGTALNLKYDATTATNDYTIKLLDSHGTEVSSLANDGKYTVEISANDTVGTCTGSQKFEVSVSSDTIIKSASYTNASYTPSYTGSEIKPTKDDLGNLELTYVDKNGTETKKTVQPTEWEIVGYTNNINATVYKTASSSNLVGSPVNPIKSQASVTIKLTGTTSNGATVTVPFNILPLEVKADYIKVPETISYNKGYNKAEEYKVPVTVVAKDANGKNPITLDAKDFTVKYEYANTSDNNKFGNKIKSTVTVTNTNYILNSDDASKKEIPAGTAIVTEIVAKALTDSMVVANPSTYTYTGGKITPDYYVIDGTTVLYKKGDIGISDDLAEYEEVDITDAVNVGTGKINVKGVDHTNTNSGYSGKATGTFTITPANTSDVKVTVDDSECKYTGKQVRPRNIKVTLNGNNVTDQFEVVSYGENISGTGTVVLKPVDGNKNFTGSNVTAEFNIVKEVVTAELKAYDSKGLEVKDKFATVNLDTGVVSDNAANPFEFDGTAHTFEKVLLSNLKKNGTDKTTAKASDFEIKYVDNVAGKKVTNKMNVGYVYAVAKDGTGFSGKYTITTADGTIIKNVVAYKAFSIDSVEFVAKNVTVKNGTYAAGLAVKPEVTVQIGGTTLVEGKDYKLTLINKPAAGTRDNLITGMTKVTPTDVTTGKVYGVYIEGINGYEGSKVISMANNDAGSDKLVWGIDKKDIKDCTVTVKDGVATVLNGYIPVASTEYTAKNNGNGTYTVTANSTSKNYTGSKTVNAEGKAVDEKPDAPMISSVKVVGNKATVILSGESEGAAGYDYVISTDRDCITNKDYDAVNKNQVKTESTFEYVGQGQYYAYCHAWKRDENGKKVFSDWSNAYPFVVSAITPSQPVITSVKVSGSTVTVTYTKAANATGYDVVLGTSTKKVNGETRPVEYGKLVKKNIKGNVVTATFKNVKKGTYYAGLHAFNRTSEDGKKVFSQWSNVKKVNVK